ncbi:MAG: hypothetical protein GX294_00555 [Candidatus Cloacimonetes bacterium]|nr:hypothetical protein [Candidatus Cloacimonadota bacterium]
MSDTLFNIKQIIALIVFIIAFSLMGMMTGQPLMVLFYAGVIALASGITFLIIRKRQRHSEISLQKNPLPKRIFGAILSLLALVTPLLMIFFTNLITIPIQIGALPIVIVLGVTLAFIALFALAIFLINHLDGFAMRLVGYLIVILVSFIPGLLISLYDKTSSTIGSIYYVALAVLVLGYNGINLLIAKD